MSQGPGLASSASSSRLFTARASVGVFSPPSSHSSLLFLPIAIHPYECVYIIYIAISIQDILLRLGTSIKLRSNSTTSTSHLRTAPHQPCPTPDPHGRRLDNRLSSCIVFFLLSRPRRKDEARQTLHKRAAACRRYQLVTPYIQSIGLSCLSPASQLHKPGSDSRS